MQARGDHPRRSWHSAVAWLALPLWLAVGLAFSPARVLGQSSASYRIEYASFDLAGHRSVSTSYQVHAALAHYGGPIVTNTGGVRIHPGPLALRNDPPAAQPQELFVAYNTPVPIRLHAIDVEGNAIQFRIVTGPTHGTLQGTPPNLVYTPTPGFSGEDVFTFDVRDPFGQSAPAAIRIIVAGPTANPVAAGGTVQVFEDSRTPMVLVGWDPNGEPLTFIIVQPPALGTLSGQPPNVVYTPRANLSGTDRFTFLVSDGVLQSAVAEMRIEILPVNDPPTAGLAQGDLAEDSVFGILLGGVDIEGDPLTYSIVTPPQFGVLTGNAPLLQYHPARDFHGTDQFTFKVNDGALDSAPSVVTLRVSPVNDPPLIQAPARQSIDSGAGPSRIGFTVTDVDSNPAAIALTVESSNVGLIPPGALGLENSGGAHALRVTPTPGTRGITMLRLRAADPEGAVAEAVIELEVYSLLVAPFLLREPDDLEVERGGTARFEVITGGSTPFTYQWLHNGNVLPGEAASSLVITGVSPNHVGTYQARISNAAGSVNSRVATLRLREPAFLGAFTAEGFQFQWRFPNGTYNLDTSTNLVTWVPLAQVQVVNGMLSYLDRDALGTPTRFYRLR